MQVNPRAIQQVFAEGLRYHQAGRLEEAERSYRRVLAVFPRHADSLNLLGVIACDMRRHDTGIDLIAKAITIRPDVASYHYNIAVAYQSVGKLELAVRHYRKAIARQQDYPDAHNNLGNALTDLGRFGEAEAAYRRAFAGKPDFQRARNNLGNVFRLQGKFDEAVAVYEEALSWGDDVCATYQGLSLCRKFTEADRPHIARMEGILRDRKLSDPDRSLLHFALGKAFDDLGVYEDAIRHFDAGNALEARRRRFDAKDFGATVDWLIGASINPAGPAPAASDSELPVLIVGLPRSGTTLVEQILASHPLIAAGGELPFWLQTLRTVTGRLETQLNPAAAQGAIRDYIALLRGHSLRAIRVTDKMPLNFMGLGEIHRLFPNARIIHCRRRPVDTALSIYFTRFAGAHDFACRRDDIVSYVQEYRRLMDHWRAVLPPDRFLEIDYETLVADQEAVSRRMIDFCGVAWDEACLDFHGTARPIVTASAWQARQPVYRTSAERWRNYEPWLGAFRRLLFEPA
jgi:tetratricopeptide (TPR) repeat protein